MGLHLEQPTEFRRELRPEDGPWLRLVLRVADRHAGRGMAAHAALGAEDDRIVGGIPLLLMARRLVAELEIRLEEGIGIRSKKDPASATARPRYPWPPAAPLS
jgi:hypothetical protein